MQERGFTLIEVLTALAILVVGALATAQVLAAVATYIRDARTHTLATWLAAQRMEQLLALEWAFDAAGLPKSDGTTNLTTTPPGRGGPGLTVSPANSLDQNVAGFVDYLDGDGTWAGTGASPPATAVFVRRWAVTSPSRSADTLVIQVLVRSVAADAAGVRGARGEAELATLRVRTVR